MMETLISLLKGVAPVLATAVAGPAGGAAVGWIASKLGIPDDTIEGVTAALTGNPEMTMKLKELDLEYAKMDAQDRDSARNREIEIAKSDVHFITKNITSILAIGILTGSIIIAMLVFFVDFPDNQENILIFVLGSLFSIATQVVSYYFGSSQGSKDKTKEIQGMMKK
jgi:hypothetical protein